VKTLVTGGAGFIGRHLVARLIEIGHEVIVVDSGFTGNLHEVNTRAEIINKDINFLKVEDWLKLLNGVNFVFHLAAQKLNTKNVTPDNMLQTNVNSTYNLAQASGIANIERFVFTSSLYAYGNLGPKVMHESDRTHPRTLYGSTKLMGENILNSVGFDLDLSWNIARLFFIYGPGQFSNAAYKSVIVKNFERLIRNLPPIINGTGIQSLDYVYVDDAVSALIKLAQIESTKNIVNIASGKSTSVNDLTKKMQEVAGTDFKTIGEVADWTEGTNRFGDVKLAKKKLDWVASTSMDLGLKRVWLSLNE
jgi:UDP-glucose 4-epimerase